MLQSCDILGAVVVATRVIIPKPWVMRHLALQTPLPSHRVGSGILMDVASAVH